MHPFGSLCIAEGICRFPCQSSKCIWHPVGGAGLEADAGSSPPFNHPPDRDAVQAVMWAVNLTATPNAGPSEQGWLYHYWQAAFISFITVKGETLGHTFLAQPWLPANVAAVELCHICKAWVTDACFLSSPNYNQPTPKLGTQEPQAHGGLPDLFITSRSACVVHPPRALPMFHPLQLFPWNFGSCDTTSSEVPTPWFPSSDEISCYQQRENIC